MKKTNSGEESEAGVRMTFLFSLLVSRTLFAADNELTLAATESKFR